MTRAKTPLRLESAISDLGLISVSPWASEESSVGTPIAVLGDIHSNLPALEAVLDEVSAAGICRGIVTGDIIGGGGQTDECISLVRSLGWPCVQGTSDRVREGGADEISRSNLVWVSSLPVRLLLPLDGATVYVTHRVTPRERRRAMDVGAACLVSGHTHHASAGPVEGLLVVNPGSVGEGLPDDPRPSWAWVVAGPDGVSAGVRFSTRVLRPARVRT